MKTLLTTLTLCLLTFSVMSSAKQSSNKNSKNTDYWRKYYYEHPNRNKPQYKCPKCHKVYNAPGKCPKDGTKLKYCFFC